MNEVIAEIQKNSLEKVRITCSEFRGGAYVDVRILFDRSQDNKRDWVCTRKGVNIPLELLPELIAGLRKAAERLDLE